MGFKTLPVLVGRVVRGKFNRCRTREVGEPNSVVVPSRALFCRADRGSGIILCGTISRTNS